jgi:hypothetical protein
MTTKIDEKSKKKKPHETRPQTRMGTRHLDLGESLGQTGLAIGYFIFHKTCLNSAVT